MELIICEFVSDVINFHQVTAELLQPYFIILIFSFEDLVFYSHSCHFLHHWNLFSKTHAPKIIAYSLCYISMTKNDRYLNRHWSLCATKYSWKRRSSMIMTFSRLYLLTVPIENTFDGLFHQQVWVSLWKLSVDHLI